MSDRRHTAKPSLNPGDVWSLPPGHPAMVENRTLFPSTVVEVTADEPERLLVSGVNNRKLGKTVEKGKFKGYALYSLSLEERATCPTDCPVRGYCYGNGMQMARRHRIGDADVFFDRLGFEIVELLDENPVGLLIRLHVLGDFPSVEYVAFWKEVLDEHSKVAIYGYTHRTDKDEIGQAIVAVKLAYPERFRIRWSTDEKEPDSAIILDHVPIVPPKGVTICPAQTDATACCATCGFCWEMAARKLPVAFIKHGRKSAGLAAEKAMAAGPAGDTRTVAPIQMPPKLRIGSVSHAAPEIRLVDPTDLRVENAYQRDLSGKSIQLIRRIVAEWDWAKFKPPIVAETGDGLFVIDGQHTAIAAASHPSIKQIPVLVAPAGLVSSRAAAFVAHNRDRLAMSTLQVFHALVTATDADAVAVRDVIQKAGGTIPRSAPPKACVKPGQVIAITAAQRIYQRRGADFLGTIIRICLKARVAPISSTILYGLEILKRDARHQRLSVDQVAGALASVKGIEFEAQKLGSEIGQNRYTACAKLLQNAILSGGIPPAGSGQALSAAPAPRLAAPARAPLSLATEN